MASLEVSAPGHQTRQATEDAKKTQLLVEKDCAVYGQDLPPYLLSELIGKGSFGRVYKANDTRSGDLVAIKMVNIEEGDSHKPGAADTFSDIHKEINTLKHLSDIDAKNINTVIDAFLVGQSMWIITEYCAGGSVATLMKPTGGLPEKWITPILREVAEGIHWIHGKGIIHRDIKCANVLVTQEGGVQLCDFGIAAMIQTKFDKRSTVTGTLHWMAPELFDSAVSYGSKVDIWAFGAMAYEIASGWPPNAMETHKANIEIMQFGDFLRSHIPRLDGPQYSHRLKDLVAFCLEESPEKRPSIEQVRDHPYLRDTSSTYPTSSLAVLVRAYKLWEDGGGTRKSLLNPMVGAQAPADLASTSMAAEWNFSTMAIAQTDVDAVRDVYGSQVDINENFKGTRPRGRRKPPQTPAMEPPLLKVFDPYTISDYGKNSQSYYGRPKPASDLPLRNDSRVRESLIDASLGGAELSTFMDTIRVPVRAPMQHDAGLEPHKLNWQWPTAVPAPRTTSSLNDLSETNSSGRPLIPAGLPQEYMNDRMSVTSLIDLDEGQIEPDHLKRPSTANSDVPSIPGSDNGGNTNPFELERHTTDVPLPLTNREPSIYIDDSVAKSTGPYDSNSSTMVPDQTMHVDNGQKHNLRFPPFAPPSTNVLKGRASPEDVANEMRRLLGSFSEHLSLLNDQVRNMEPNRRNSRDSG